MDGDADIARVAGVIADPGRSRMLMALADGRALAASVLAAEAGVAASTASEHLAKLVDAGMVTAQREGRHRYFRMAGPEIGELIEALARVAPPAPVRSLRQGTRAEAVRTARTCYDHLAGRLGTALMGGLLSGGSDRRWRRTAHTGRPAVVPGRDVDYRVTASGRDRLGGFGIDVGALDARPRPTVRYCVDWSEQRHHLAGGLGAALCDRMFELGWLARADTHRTVRVSDAGEAGLADVFGVSLPR